MICRLPLRVFHLLWEMGGYKQFEKKPFPTIVLIFVFAIMPFHDKHVFFLFKIPTTVPFGRGIWRVFPGHIPVLWKDVFLQQTITWLAPKPPVFF